MKYHLEFSKALIAYQILPIPAMFDILSNAKSRALVELETLGPQLAGHIASKYQEQYTEVINIPMLTRDPIKMVELIENRYNSIKTYDAQVYDIICKACQSELNNIGSPNALELSDKIRDESYKKYLHYLFN